MATTVGTRPLIKTGVGGGPKPRGPNGNGGPKRNGHKRRFPDFQSSANRYRIGMWVALASILMMFTALSSAYIVRAASASDWQPLKMPRILLLSTALIVISSGTLETARRKWRETVSNGHRTWLVATLILGFGFLLSQLLAWRQLVGQGVYVASNPHSSFFYLLTAAHGVHLLAFHFADARQRTIPWPWRSHWPAPTLLRSTGISWTFCGSTYLCSFSLCVSAQKLVAV